MGRFSSVQTFADTAKAAPVPYDKAGGAGAPSGAAGTTVRVPKVMNVSGSTAGAGSGNFHCYRKERRAESDRLDFMSREHEETLAEQEFRARQAALTQEAAERTRRNAERRKRKRRHVGAGAKRGRGEKDDEDEDESGDEEADGDCASANVDAACSGARAGAGAGAGAAHVSASAADAAPMPRSGDDDEGAERVEKKQLQDATDDLPNDGSFLSAFLASVTSK